MLWLDSTQVTDAGLAHLKAWRNLRVLRLDSTRVTDSELLHLKAANLRVLSLDSTRVTDSGLLHLKARANLRELNLDSTQVTDSELLHLKRGGARESKSRQHPGKRLRTRAPPGDEPSILLVSQPHQGHEHRSATPSERPTEGDYLASLNHGAGISHGTASDFTNTIR